MSPLPRLRIRVPSHLRPHVEKYGLDEWFSKEKNCAARTRWLDKVPDVHAVIVSARVATPTSEGIEWADDSLLKTVVTMFAHVIDDDESLVDWIEGHNQSYPTTPEDWYSICLAAAWVVIQAFFRERTPSTGGE